MWTEEREEIRSSEIEMFVPLMNKGNLIAILAVTDRRDGKLYTGTDIRLLESHTSRVAASMAKAQLYAGLEEKSRKDDLTGLSNRRHFGERLEEEVSRHSRYGGAFSVFMLDLDNFKHYNDTYGHPAGDALLSQTGKIIEGSIRDADHAFRYGGDEFAVILPEATSRDAYIVAERVRTGIAKGMEEQAIAVTASIGLANYPADGVVADEIVRAADSALYHAKRAGGNRVHPSNVSSRIDEFTGSYDRHRFEERLNEEVSRHWRYGGAFSIFMLDLDDFKAYNDAYGRPAGDALLSQAGRIIRSSIRDADQAFRYGGDEFAVILPQTTSKDAYVVAERVLVQIGKRMERQPISVTASIGLANYPADGVVAFELVHVAENALDHAKRAGGNRIHPSCSIL
jgi:diguanylate cyclase (GGDEF)-like protein